MDGNGRWAKKRFLPRQIGHRAGVSALKEIVKASSNIGIKYLTVYAFSTENWKRPLYEINYLMDLLMEGLRREIDELHANGVRINILGDYWVLPDTFVTVIQNALNKTAANDGLILNVAFNYGARAEIVKAVQAIAQQVKDGIIAGEDIDEKKISGELYTKDIPDPDLIIRTAGEYRISNFLLWQMAYAEIYITDCLWPDFKPEELYRAVVDYQQRERKYGGIKEEQNG